jgi:hypothetical protein
LRADEDDDEAGRRSGDLTPVTPEQRAGPVK